MKRPGIPRRAWIRRRTKPSPGGTPRTRKPRKPSEFARIFGSKKRVAWIQGLPSVASGKGPCVNAHVRTGGTSRKADACWIVPLTDREHRHELHQHGAPWFEARYGIDLDACAMATEAAWQAHEAAA